MTTWRFSLMLRCQPNSTFVQQVPVPLFKTQPPSRGIFRVSSLGHNATFDGRVAATPADIPGVNTNVSIARVFNTAGTYNYHCTIHPNMTGSVLVR